MSQASPVPAVIVKCLPFPLHTGAVAIARTLGRLGVPVHLVGDRASGPLARSRYVTGVAVEASAATGEELRDRLLAAPLIEGAVLFPVDDPAALFVADHADELGRRFRLPAQPSGLARSLADKRGLARLAAAAGVPSPRSVAVGSAEEAEAFLADHGLPVMVKAGDPIPLHRQEGATSVTLAHTEEEFHQAVARLLEGSEPNVLLQEYIPGDPSTVWMVNAYLDRQGQCGFAGVGRKLRQYPVGRGATTLGVTEDNDEVLSTALSLLSFTGYRGVVDMGLRFDERDGRYKVLDVNPRVGATFRLFSAADGTDVVRAMYLDLTDRPVPSSAAATGRHWWNEPWDLAGALGEWRAGRLDASAYLTSLRAVDETALYARDDPAPLLGGWRAGGRRIATAAGAVVAEQRHQASRRDGRRDGDLAPGRVRTFFESRATYWHDLYQDRDVFAAVYRERLDRALAIVDALGLPPRSRALEVGCGAGLATVGLATRGLSVDAIDASPAMVASAIEEVRRAGVAEQVTASVADARALEAEDATYDLVLVLGVLPWLDAPAAALAEIRRVLAPGGRVIVTVDNKFRASSLLDPRTNPLLAPAQGALRRRLAGLGVRKLDPVPIAAAHAPGQFDDLVAGAGLEKEEGFTLGFGPFTVFNREPLPATLGTRLDRRLQDLADQGVPLVRHAGAQYLVVARRPSNDALALQGSR